MDFVIKLWIYIFLIHSLYLRVEGTKCLLMVFSWESSALVGCITLSKEQIVPCYGKNVYYLDVHVIEKVCKTCLFFNFLHFLNKLAKSL